MRVKAVSIHRRGYMGLVYIAPWILGFTILQLYPFIMSMYYSLTDYGSSAKNIHWVGLKNYITLFTIDKEFLNSLVVTFKYTLFTVPGKLVMALFIAVILNRKLRGINFIRTIYYLPSLFGGSIAVAILWKLMFMDRGVVNGFMHVLGIPAIQWLGNPSVALTTICLLEIWQFGSSMVMFLAALKQVPSTLYEAAAIDGANPLQAFSRITLPQITPIIFFNLIIQTINALQSFTNAFVITNGGPLKATYVLGIKLYTEAFSYFKMGYASAISWVLFAIVMVITLILFRSSSGWVYYEDGGDF